MQPIKELLNKIKWDKRENPEDYTLIYIDLGKEKQLAYTKIKKLEGNFMITERNNKEINIPLHRIRKVKKNNKIIWQR